MAEKWRECNRRGRKWHGGGTAECRAFAHLFPPEAALVMGEEQGEPARAPLPLVTPAMCARCDRSALVEALEGFTDPAVWLAVPWIAAPPNIGCHCRFCGAKTGTQDRQLAVSDLIHNGDCLIGKACAALAPLPEKKLDGSA